MLIVTYSEAQTSVWTNQTVDTGGKRDLTHTQTHTHTHTQTLPKSVVFNMKFGANRLKDRMLYSHTAD